MKGRDALREMMNNKTGDVAAVPPKRTSGAVRAMSLELQHLSEEASTARALRQTLASSEPTVELAPGDIDPSPVADRIPTDQDPAFEELKQAIADKGQQVPILVRPHPERSGRYQIAYGRRRLRAALELGKPVRAIIKKLSDTELIIAQAQENGPRADLSFIERALFAANLNTHGLDRDTITSALGVDKPELSRLLMVAATITSTLISAIGPAPKIGRPRWLLLAERCAEADAVARAQQATASDRFKTADTNTRFNLVLTAITSATAAPSQKAAINTDRGQRVGWLERTKKGVRISSEQPEFAVFLEQRLPGLLREFEAAEAQATNQEKGGR
jgi:ParB family chromosome partitioning protein